MGRKAELRRAVAELEVAYDAQFARLTAMLEKDRQGPFPYPDGVTPYSMTDNTGRPILMDALVTLVQARKALL